MYFESKLDPKARNRQSSASGLIQFMDATAVGLGTTIEAVREMNFMQQLNLTYKYFLPFKGRIKTLEDCYMAIFMPSAVGKPLSWELAKDDPKRARDAYDVNRGLDLNRDGRITKGEAATRVRQEYNRGFTAEFYG